MTEARQDSSQQNKSCGWIKNFVGVIFAALLLLVVFQELHSLSKDMDESRKLLKEFSGRLAKIEKENEDLRKELRRTKAKTMLQVFSNMQKVPHVRRSRKSGRDMADKCKKKWHHCFNKVFNCSMIKNCIPSRGKDYIHAFVLRALDKESLPTGFRRMKLPWNKFIPNDRTVTVDDNYSKIVIHTSGLYFVYCRLTVSEHIRKVFIWKGDSVLFSSLPTLSNGSLSDGSRYGVVQMFGLAEITGGESLYVQVDFRSESEARKFLNDTIEGMAKLFPEFDLDTDVTYSYNASSYVIPDRNINSFGAFKVS